MSNFTIYSTATCTYCKQAKALLTKKGLTYTEVILTHDNMDNFKKITNNASTVPQIFYHEANLTKHIGGYTDLVPFLEGWWPDAKEGI
jgi:glutaredoxin 3